MTVPKSIPKRYRSRIQSWDDERGMGNSLIVSLNDGWYWKQEGEGVHVRGFDTVAEARSDLRDTAPCNCKECRKNLGE